MTHTRTHRRSFCGPDAGYAIEQSIIIIFRRDLNNWFNLTIVYLLFFLLLFYDLFALCLCIFKVYLAKVHNSNMKALRIEIQWYDVDG